MNSRTDGSKGRTVIHKVTYRRGSSKKYPSVLVFFLKDIKNQKTEPAIHEARA